jgi:hypothetical protein
MDKIFEHAEQSVEEDMSHLGIKGPSILSLVPTFDVAKGFVPVIKCIQYF